MKYLLILGGVLLGYLALAKNAGASGILAALTGKTVKLGNQDPNFEPWLVQEMQKLFGAPGGAAAFRQIDFDNLEGAIRNGQLGGNYPDREGGIWTPGYWRNSPGDCGGAGSLGAFGTSREIGAFAGASSQTADTLNTVLGLSGTLEKVANAIPVVGGIISGITSIFGRIFGAHAQAVAQEQGTLCQAVPAANAWLQQIDAAYNAGQLSGPQAVQAMEQIYAQWEQGVSGIIQPADENLAEAEQIHECNAACVYLRELRGIIDAKTLFDY